VELRTALLIIGGLVLVAMAFYAGKQFNYIRYLIASKKRDAALEQVAQKYPGVSSEELITTALAARKRGDWSEAVDRLLAAKRSNPTLPGLLFLIGKTSFDRGELDTADLAFSHAIRFNENVAASSYHRGLIALRRQDTGAAIRYFEAAAEAEPFISDTYFSWGEALRLDGRARDAIRRYEQAEQRSTRAEDSTLCAFKIRLARIEAGDAAAVAAEIEQRGDAGARSVDWLMTDAALHLHRGMTADAARLISEARALGLPAIFLTCAADNVFRKAAETHEEVRAALRTVAVPQ
jgi:tetratricopeptide (TPR) repeat protein